MYFFGSLWVWFCIHIGYRGTMILRKLSQPDSSNSLWVWCCIHIGYWGIMILCKLSQHDSSNSLCLWLGIHIGYWGIRILASCLNVILQLGFVRGFVFILVTGVSCYRSIMILCELSLHDSSTSLYVLFCIHIGYMGIMILKE